MSNCGVLGPTDVRFMIVRYVIASENALFLSTSGRSSSGDRERRRTNHERGTREGVGAIP